MTVHDGFAWQPSIYLGLNNCLSRGFPSDPNQGESQRFYASPGVIVRLTRKLDKDSGFVIGAVGVVHRILSMQGEPPVAFTVELSTGVLVLVHPIVEKRMTFLPCTYAYATTIRRAQGGTFRHGSIWFDRVHPPERGYGYVAASRFKSNAGIYLYGQVHRTDWLPVRHSKKAMELDQVDRGEESMSDYDSEEEEAMARPCDDNDDDDSGSDGCELDCWASDGVDYEAKLKDYEWANQLFTKPADAPGLYEIAESELPDK